MVASACGTDRASAAPQFKTIYCFIIFIMFYSLNNNIIILKCFEMILLKNTSGRCAWDRYH